MEFINILMHLGNSYQECLTIVDMDDPKRPCVYANQKFYENTLFEKNEVIGKNLAFLQGDNTDPKTIDFMKECFSKNMACCQDLVNYRKDGTAFLNRLVMLPFKSGDKNFFIGFQNDVTEVKGLNSESEILNKISDHYIRHNINNPLTIILNSFSSLLKHRKTPEEVEERIKVCFDRIHNFVCKIDDLKDFENFVIEAAA